MIVITFAVPEESSEFRKQLRLVRNDSIPGMATFTGRLAERDIVVAHVGIGLESAKKRAALLLSQHEPELVIAAGFGGALSPVLKLGDVVLDQRGNTLLGSVPPDARTGRIVTSPNPIETVADKTTLFSSSGADVVDMETDAIAAVCAEKSIPLIAVRAISDAANDPLPIPLPAWFDLEKQQTRPFVLLGYLLSHPSAIMPFLRFVSGLAPVRQALCHGLVSIVHRLIEFPRKAR